MLLVLGCANAWAGEYPRAASESEISAVTEAVKKRLKDPDSARLEDVRIGADGKTICGLVNAKNSFGGYTGASKFIGMYFPSEDGGKPLAAIIGIDSGRQVAAATMCADQGI